MNITLLGGLAAIAIPIALHLIMRREPQRLEFPALRFVKQRRQTNQRRLKLRHWLLLALRCAVLALLAFALARPVLWGNGRGGAPNTEPAIAVVVDNALGMAYKQQGTTRLELARTEATWLLEQLPAGARAAVVDRSSQRSPRLADRDGALLRVERMSAASPRRTLAASIAAAVDLVATSATDAPVYVFTDLSTGSFDDAALATLGPVLARNPSARLHLVDISDGNTRNQGLNKLELSSQRPSKGEPLTIATGVYGAGSADEANATVEVWLGEAGGEPTKRLSKPAAAYLEFALAGLDVGVHQGYVRLIASDPLPIDNTRYFTVQVVDPPKVLLLEQEPGDGVFLREALAPSALGGVAAARFVCDTSSYDRVDARLLNRYDAVVLLDPPPLAAAKWRLLSGFAQSGGGVAVCLGRRAVGHLSEMNSAAAQLVLPGKLKYTSRTPRYLQPRSYEHPILRELADVAGETPWPRFPVFQAWQFDSFDRAASVASYFADGLPAIVERTTGNGRVVVVATPLSDRATEDAWNLLPTNPDPWPFLILANGLADYLVGTDTHPLNYTAGQTVVLPLPRRSQLSSFVLTPPEGDPLVQTVDPLARDLVVTLTDIVGNYRAQSGGTQGGFVRGSARMSQQKRASSRKPASTTLAVGWAADG